VFLFYCTRRIGGRFQLLRPSLEQRNTVNARARVSSPDKNFTRCSLLSYVRAILKDKEAGDEGHGNNEGL